MELGRWVCGVGWGDGDGVMRAIGSGSCGMQGMGAVGADEELEEDLWFRGGHKLRGWPDHVASPATPGDSWRVL